MHEHQTQQDAQKIGVREFREKLSNYIEGSDTIAVTKHGETVAYFIPTKPEPGKHEFDALVTASEKMQGLLKEMNVSEDELVADFEAARKIGRERKKNEE